MAAAAGITWWNFYFRLYPTTIKAPQVVDFLGHLLRHIRGKLLVVWGSSRLICRLRVKTDCGYCILSRRVRCPLGQSRYKTACNDGLLRLS